MRDPFSVIRVLYLRPAPGWLIEIFDENVLSLHAPLRGIPQGNTCRLVQGTEF